MYVDESHRSGEGGDSVSDPQLQICRPLRLVRHDGWVVRTAVHRLRLHVTSTVDRRNGGLLEVRDSDNVEARGQLATRADVDLWESRSARLDDGMTYRSAANQHPPPLSVLAKSRAQYGVREHSSDHVRQVILAACL
jgi:hypothetical protein